MQQEIATPVDLKVLMNHIYEYKKGVRRLVLYTFNKKYESFAITRLERQNIDYIIQPVGNDRLNLFFGKKECLDAIRMIITKPLCSVQTNVSTPCACCSAARCTNLRRRRILSWVPCWDMTSAPNANAIVSGRRRFAKLFFHHCNVLCLYVERA